MSKHFNAGNVWGKIVKAEEKASRDKGTPYCDLEIDCRNNEYGPVKAYGRMWGKEKIAAVMTMMEDAKQPVCRFRGFYGQYEDKGIRYSSFTFFDFEKAEEEKPRAAFILVGEITGKEIDADAEPKISLNVVRPSKDADLDERYDLYLFDFDSYYRTEVGDLIEVRGVIRKRTAEDEYGGGTDDHFKPYVMIAKNRKK